MQSFWLGLQGSVGTSLAKLALRADRPATAALIIEEHLRCSRASGDEGAWRDVLAHACRAIGERDDAKGLLQEGLALSDRIAGAELEADWSALLLWQDLAARGAGPDADARPLSRTLCALGASWAAAGLLAPGAAGSRQPRSPAAAARSLATWDETSEEASGLALESLRGRGPPADARQEAARGIRAAVCALTGGEAAAGSMADRLQADLLGFQVGRRLMGPGTCLVLDPSSDEAASFWCFPALPHGHHPPHQLLPGVAGCIEAADVAQARH